MEVVRITKLVLHWSEFDHVTIPGSKGSREIQSLFITQQISSLLL